MESGKAEGDPLCHSPLPWCKRRIFGEYQFLQNEFKTKWEVRVSALENDVTSAPYQPTKLATAPRWNTGMQQGSKSQ